MFPLPVLTYLKVRCAPVLNIDYSRLALSKIEVVICRRTFRAAAPSGSPPRPPACGAARLHPA
ncbi:hypothetical protein EQG66_10130 [Sphingobium fluviale]|uniref:Uncharacterized protein n=1 Tax=Sphingobium fluviale TaxID=2506423 RepID=A0A4Q1KGG1_9SPHN|nr:hypothetical protein EQG66_10130 [Sphingobium fluviale]